VLPLQQQVAEVVADCSVVEAMLILQPPEEMPILLYPSFYPNRPELFETLYCQTHVDPQSVQ